MISPIKPASYSVKNKCPSAMAVMQRGPAARGRYSVFAKHRTVRRHAADLVGEVFSEPKVAVGADGDAAQRSVRRRDRKLDNASIWREPA